MRKSTPGGALSGATTTLRLAWQHVLHDNHRLMPVVQKGRARMITSPDYRLAKKACEIQLVAQWKRDPITGPVRLHARAYFPDARKRDAGNYRKLITDALTGIAYSDDSQLHSETWDFAGIDRQNPRIEVEVCPAA